VQNDSIRVKIFGDEYSIRGDVDSETTRKIAEYVDAKMIEIYEKGVSKDKLKIAILSALNIAGQLFEYKSIASERAVQLDVLSKRIEDITQKIQQSDSQ